MSNYEKPVVVMAEESTEGVYLASGDHLEQCRFGRTEGICRGRCVPGMF